MRSKSIPSDAEVVRTYDELGGFRDAFFNGEFHFLLLVGRPGLSKSWEFEERSKPYKDRDGNEISVAHYIKGNVSPVVAYQRAYMHRNKLLTLDDAERLWADSPGRFLVRDLTECKPRKWVNWLTENNTLKRLGVPQSFETSSRVCLIMNRFAFGDAHEYEAIVDRAQFIYFDPTLLEIHKHTALWFWDQEIFDFIGGHLNIFDPQKLSARTYVKASERKSKGDWQDFLISRYCRQEGKEWVIALENDPKFKSVDERVAEFVERTGLGRSTYFNFKKELKTGDQLRPVDVPRLTLNARPPEIPDLEAEARAEAKKRRILRELLEQQQQDEQEYRDMEDKFFGDAEDEDGE